MISKLVADNYRSLGPGVEVPLRQMTALVGQNAAGKSSILDALRFLSECVRDDLPTALQRRNGLGALRHRTEGPKPEMSLRVEMGWDDGTGLWEFSLGEDERGDYCVVRENSVWEPAPSNQLSLPLRIDYANGVNQIQLGLPIHDYGDLSRIVEALRGITCYNILPDQLRPPQKSDTVRRPMDEQGHNWASTLRRLKRDEAGQELIAGLARITGDISDYRVNQVGGYLVTEFRHGPNLWLDASQESDGTLRIAALLTALLQDPAPTLIGLEEPELTVHPGALPILFDFINEARSHSQIVLSTHSPDLLDLLDADDVLVVSQNISTTVAPLDQEQRRALKDHLLSASDLLRAEGLRPQAADRTDE